MMRFFLKCLAAFFALVTAVSVVAWLKEYDGGWNTKRKAHEVYRTEAYREMDRGLNPQTGGESGFSSSDSTKDKTPANGSMPTSDNRTSVIYQPEIGRNPQSTAQNYNLQYLQYNSHVNIQQIQLNQYQQNIRVGPVGGYYPNSTPYYSSTHLHNHGPSPQTVRFRERQADRYSRFKSRTSH